MSHRGLLFASAKITPAMLQAALDLRKSVRDYLQRDPTDRREDSDAARGLNRALKLFHLAEARDDRCTVLRPARGDALAGLSAVIAELHQGSIDGTLDRLKCARRKNRAYGERCAVWPDLARNGLVNFVWYAAEITPSKR
jgi:hypothetical protein